jgi:hypothetical protein
MTENDTPWPQEDNSWRKGTRHDSGRHDRTAFGCFAHATRRLGAPGFNRLAWSSFLKKINRLKALPEEPAWILAALWAF